MLLGQLRFMAFRVYDKGRAPDTMPSMSAVTSSPPSETHTAVARTANPLQGVNPGGSEGFCLRVLG